MNKAPSELRNKVIRIFISSTFEDVRKERDILQQKVYPYLVDLCAPRGWQIDFVDLRWGISKEAGVQQKTMRICLQELERCMRVSPRPNFLILQGQHLRTITLYNFLTKESRVITTEDITVD